MGWLGDGVRSRFSMRRCFVISTKLDCLYFLLSNSLVDFVLQIVYILFLMLYFIYTFIHVSRLTSLDTPTVKCLKSTLGCCQSTFLGCSIHHVAKIIGGGDLVAVFIVIHRSIHFLSL